MRYYLISLIPKKPHIFHSEWWEGDVLLIDTDENITLYNHLNGIISNDWGICSGSFGHAKVYFMSLNLKLRRIPKKEFIAIQVRNRLKSANSENS